jgi:hypothetical protein
MSFIESKTNATVYAPGYFLASEDCKRITTEIAQAKGTTVGTAKVVKAGTVYPSNDGNAIGIVYEDVDVTSGDMPGSIVTEGTVYEDRLPAAIESAAEAVLTGITVIATSPAVTRPAWISGELKSLTVASVASATATGKTAVTVSGYTLKTGESYKYKIDSSTAPSVTLGQTDWTGWTTWDGESEIASTTGYKMTMAVLDNAGAAIAAGSCDVTVKAAG